LSPRETYRLIVVSREHRVREEEEEKNEERKKVRLRLRLIEVEGNSCNKNEAAN
jgi:hypothetical protein